MKFVKNLLLSTSVATLTIFSPLLLAHGDEVHTTAKPANGGQIVAAGTNYYELVVAKDSKDVKENAVFVYVTDHAGTKIPTTGATGSVTLLAGKLKATATLTPDGDNRLKGSTKYASDSAMKAVVSIMFAGKVAEQARFTPLAVAQDGHAEHKH